MSAVPQSVKSNLLAAFRHLLKPLVRLAIKNGVSVREFSQAIKGTYVDVAKKQIAAAGDKATREAIAVMLNIDTNDIADILAAPASANFQYEDDQSSPVSRVLAGWFTDSRSSGPYGVLVDVPFEASGETTRGWRYLEEGLSRLPADTDVHTVANYRLSLGRAMWETNQAKDAQREYEKARDSLKDKPPSRELAIAQLRLSGIHTFALNAEEAHAAAVEAVRVAEAAGADDARAWALNFLGLSLLDQGLEDEGFDFLDRSYRDAMALGLYMYAANACYNDLWCRVQLQRTEAIEDRLARFNSLPSTPQNDYMRPYIESQARLLLGEVERAAALAQRGLHLAQESGNAKFTWRIQVQQAAVLVEQDELESAWGAGAR